MYKFINILPTVSKKFTNVKDFHDFLKLNIICNKDHKYEYSGNVADISVTSVIKSVEYSSITLEAAKIVGNEVHEILSYACENRRICGDVGFLKEQTLLVSFINDSEIATELPMVVGIELDDRTVALGGTCDLIVVKNELTQIVEHKTATTLNMNDWTQQIAMYSAMYRFLANIYLKDFSNEIDPYINITHKLNIKQMQRNIDLENTVVVEHFMKKLDVKTAIVIEKRLDEDEVELIDLFLRQQEELNNRKKEIKALERQTSELEQKLRSVFANQKIKATFDGHVINSYHSPVIRTIVDTERAKDLGLQITKHYEDSIVLEINNKKFCI